MPGSKLLLSLQSSDAASPCTDLVLSWEDGEETDISMEGRKSVDGGRRLLMTATKEGA